MTEARLTPESQAADTVMAPAWAQPWAMLPRWGDLGAGLCVAGLLIPEAVAYAGLAHLPVANALTATVTGLAIYALFGGSRFAIVAPTSSTATLSAAAIVSIPGSAAVADPARYLQELLALVFMVGVTLTLLSWARQGQLSAFVARPVLRGFAFALALSIVVKQLPDALGLMLPPTMAFDPFHIIAFAAGHPQAWHGPTVLMALVAGVGLAGLKRWPQLPASMLVMMVAIVAAALLDLKALGVREVGTVVRPTFHLAFPLLPWEEWLRLSELAFGLVVLVFAESWGSMRGMALSRGDTLNANKELMVLGACNLASSLLQGMVVGAGFSATSANAAAGAQSRWAGAVALVVIAAALALALPLLHLLPRPVLAVAVVSALWHALSLKPILAVWRMNRDRLLVIASVAAVLLFGVLYGMLAAVALSLLAALQRFGQPVVHELGELGSSRNFVVLDGHTDTAAVSGLLIVRPEEPLFFASAERVASEIMRIVSSRPAVKCVVLSLEESSNLDSTAGECLLELRQRLGNGGRSLILARVKQPIRELLAHLESGGIGSADRMFWSVADAVEYACGLQDKRSDRI